MSNFRLTFLSLSTSQQSRSCCRCLNLWTPLISCSQSFTEKLPWPYVEVMGSILQAKHSASCVSLMNLTCALLMETMHSLGLKLIFYKILTCHAQKSEKITVKCVESKWHDGISHQFWFRDLEMMSAACIPVVGIIKKRGVSFQSIFLLHRVSTHSFGIQGRSAEFLRLKLEVRIWSCDTFQSSIPCSLSFQSCPAYCNFPFCKNSIQAQRITALNLEKKITLLVWLVFIFHKYFVIWDHSHTPWQWGPAVYLNLSVVWLLFGKVNHSLP